MILNLCFGKLVLDFVGLNLCFRKMKQRMAEALANLAFIKVLKDENFCL